VTQTHRRIAGLYILRDLSLKQDPVRRWALPDRVFFACGACHILAFAFLEAYPDAGYEPFWIRPTGGRAGNHIVLLRGDEAFDYHGYSAWSRLAEHFVRRNENRWPGWGYDLLTLEPDALGACPGKGQRAS